MQPRAKGAARLGPRLVGGARCGTAPPRLRLRSPSAAGSAVSVGSAVFSGGGRPAAAWEQGGDVRGLGTAKLVLHDLRGQSAKNATEEM
jgi:hypothetical protein